ncbi:MAG TPA: hypothetical protein VFP61_01000 [Acidimicrobiales bacterium]|nr:hypothetical protein [Acidimicrobiales bacterium]
MTERARRHRDAIAALAAPSGITNLRLLTWPGMPAAGPLELVVDIDIEGRTGLELFEFTAAVGDLIGAEVLAGTEAGERLPAGWRVDPL